MTRNAAATVGRGAKKALVTAAPPSPPRTFQVLDTAQQPDTEELCPTCCETLDGTDKDFYPCPCGYQLCLFCYGKVKDQYEGRCPGCRRDYGEPVDAASVKSGSAAARSSAASLTTAASGGILPGQTHIRANDNKIDAARAAKLQTANVRNGQLGQSRREEAAALPTGASWATVGQVTQHQSSDTGRASVASRQLQQQQAVVDVSAWPSLADSSTALAPSQNPLCTPRQDRSNRHQSVHTSSSGSHHRSTSAGSVSTEDMQSSSCSSSQDVVHDQAWAAHAQHTPHSLPAFDAFGTAQSSLAAPGARHNSYMPQTAGSAAVDTQPVTPPLQQAGEISSKEAGARIVAMLRHKQAGQGASGTPAAGRAPPPGFGGGPVKQPAACSSSAAEPQLQQGQVHASSMASCGPNNQDPSVAGPPLGRYQPIQPPAQQHPSRMCRGQGTGATCAGHIGTAGMPSSSSSQDSNNGTYSMWSGIPGIELGIGAFMWQSPLGVQACGGALRVGGPGLDPPPLNMPMPSLAAKAPPPGFGPAFGMRPVGSLAHVYDPLQAQLAGCPKAPPPGMAVYRAQHAFGF